MAEIDAEPLSMAHPTTTGFSRIWRQSLQLLLQQWPCTTNHLHDCVDGALSAATMKTVEKWVDSSAVMEIALVTQVDEQKGAYHFDGLGANAQFCS